jgi:RNA polymerase sigma-70 factor (ECF subfamily)
MQEMTFQEVYQEHFRFVWRSLRRLGVRESDVADAVQDVFVVVHRKIADFEGRSKVTTWLFGICLRVARDRRRLAHVRHDVSDEAVLSERAEAWRCSRPSSTSCPSSSVRSSRSSSSTG